MLVHWLINFSNPDGETEPDQALRIALRARAVARRGRADKPDLSMLSLPNWLLVLARYLPGLWFSAKVNGWLLGAGAEYRWLLKQPYLAPHDPGTFLGFAERLTKDEHQNENQEQLARLLVNAFLADLRRAYRRFPRFVRSARRTTYPVVLLDGIDSADGDSLPGLISAVRSETGRFDPLVLITSGAHPPQPDVRVHPLDEAVASYKAWAKDMLEERRSRRSTEWYLTFGVPAKAAPPKNVPPLETQPPIWFARLRFMVPAAVALVVGTAAGVVIAIDDAQARHRAQHCGLSADEPDASTLFTVGDECVGVSTTGFPFRISDGPLGDVQRKIGAQNRVAERQHERNPRRPYVTLAYVSTLSSTATPPAELTAQRESLAGIAVGQLRQLEKNGDDDPLIRIVIGNAGERMKSGPFVADLLGDLAAEDPSLVGVLGFEQSRASTLRTVEALTRVGLPMISAALSADEVPQHSPMYRQVSPNNTRQAGVAAAYAATLTEDGGAQDPIAPTIRVLHSSDEDDIYSANLREVLRTAFDAPHIGFAVEEAPYEPARTDGAELTPGAHSARMRGQQSCGYDGLVFFAGRPEDFETFLSAVNEHCRAEAPAILAADDISRFVANPDLRERYPAISYRYLTFAVGSTHCDPRSDLYSRLARLFEDECRDGRDPSLDGHAALAYDALRCFIRAAEYLADGGRGIPLTPGTMWHALSGITGDGALDGESGRIDFGGPGGGQVPVDKNIVVMRVSGGGRPSEVGACGRHGTRAPSPWCPPTG